MAGVLTLLYEQVLTGQSSLTVVHGLSRAGLATQLIVSGVVSPELLLSSCPTPSDPLNSIDLVFSGPTTGRIQVLGAAGDFIQLPSAAQAVQLATSAAYGSERFYAEQTTPNTHTSTSLQPALTLNVTLAGGTYELKWYYEWALDTTSRDIVADVSVDGSAVSHQRQEPKDSSGSSAGGSWSGTDQSYPVSGFWEGALLAGAHTLDLSFATSNAAYQATVYRSRLSLVRTA